MFSILLLTLICIRIKLMFYFSGVKIKVTLWGPLAYKMNDWILANITNTFRNIVIIQFGKLNVWNG